MIDIQTVDRRVELRGNVVSYRNRASYFMEKHCHDALQILIPLEGAHYEISWAVGLDEMESKPLGASDICIIPPLLEHEVRWSNRANFVNFYILPDFINNCVTDGFDSQQDIIDARIGFDDQMLYQLALSLRHYMLAHEQENETYFEAVLTVVAQHIVSNYLTRRDDTLLFNDYAQIPSPKIREAIMLMGNQLDHAISVEDIAKQVGMSQYHFMRSFKEMVGMSPAKFHMMQRIEKAKELLGHKTSILDVAMQLGFSSQSHFSNVFTKSVGVTPGKFAGK